MGLVICPGNLLFACFLGFSPFLIRGNELYMLRCVCGKGGGGGGWMCCGLVHTRTSSFATFTASSLYNIFFRLVL